MTQIDNNILRVHEQQSLLENQRTTVETVAAMQAATKAQKETMAEFKIDNVDKVLEEIVEQNDQMQEIQAALAQPLGPAAEIDEDDLLNELQVGFIFYIFVGYNNGPLFVFCFFCI